MLSIATLQRIKMISSLWYQVYGSGRIERAGVSDVLSEILYEVGGEGEEGGGGADRR